MNDNDRDEPTEPEALHFEHPDRWSAEDREWAFDAGYLVRVPQ